MAERSSPDTGLEQLEILLENEENYCRMLALQRNQAGGTVIETASLFLCWSRLYLKGTGNDSASSTTTTPDPLDTAFLNVSTICLLGDRHRCDLLFYPKETNIEDQHGQISLSAAQSESSSFVPSRTFHSQILCSAIGQTARDASLTVHGMIDTLLERQPTNLRLRSAMTTMVSTGTDPKTPIKMTSFGTMPKTPVAATATSSLSVSANEIIDLSSPTLSATDPQSPSGETIDLCTPNTPTNTGSSP